MLQIGKANEVKFKVGVNGTQATPAVRLVIGANEHELGFKAEKLLGGGADDWYSEVKIPEDMTAGEYDFRVEVVVNNRLFTPVKRKVMIGAPEPTMAVESIQPAAPTQKPKQTETWEGEGGSLPKTPEEPTPLPSKPIDPLKPREQKTIASRPAPKQVIAPSKNLMKEAANKDVTIVRKSVKLKPFNENKVPAKPAPRITMADIAAESTKRFDEVLKESASYKPPVAPVKSVIIQHHIPVTLTKGDIIYE